MLRVYNILLFGFPVRVLIWILIAFFLGLVFSMLQWPEFWRRFFHKQHAKNLELRKDEKNKLNKLELNKLVEEKAAKSVHRVKAVMRILLLIVSIALVLLGIFYLVGLWL